MNTKYRRAGIAALMGISANTALATYVEGKIYCDIDNSGDINPTVDVVLQDVDVTVTCLGPADQSSDLCPEPAVPLTDITDQDGYYLISLPDYKELDYNIDIGESGVLIPASAPVNFPIPIPSYNHPYASSPWNRWIAEIDWLVSSDACQEPGDPNIKLVKEVSLNGGAFVDANTVATAPAGGLGSNAAYRLTVTNNGTEALNNVVVSDPTLGLLNQPIGVDPLNPGEVVVLTTVDAAFQELTVNNACDSRGAHLNTATADGVGAISGGAVNSQDIAYIVCEEPQIGLQKQVSLDGVNYYEADLPSDGDVPVGVIGMANAYYRLVVSNLGSENLTNVNITDATIGIDTTIADLVVGETKVIVSGEAGFGALYQADICGGSAGNKSNVASVTAEGVISGNDVAASNPANVKCINGPAIALKKQVRFYNDSQFVDADTAGTGPTAQLNDSELARTAIYRFVVTNVGDEDLTDVNVSDAQLNIAGVTIADLPVGAEVVIGHSDAGFENLRAVGQCDQEGSKLNVAHVRAEGSATGTAVSSEDPAYVNCEQPVQCTISVDQTCAVKVPASDDLLCTDSISATTLRYTGPNLSNATVTFSGKDSGNVTYRGVDLLSGVTILTKPNQNDYTIDAGVGEKLGSKTTIKINGVEEIIHTSCSAIYTAGEPAPLDGNTPNPPNSEKGDPSPNWKVVNFRQRDDIVMSEPVDFSEPADACEVPFEGAEVALTYKVKNTGDTVVDINSVMDANLGEMLNPAPATLGSGESLTITSDPVFVNQSVVNSVQVNANATGNQSAMCSAEDSVAIEAAPAPELSCEDGKPAKLGITYVGGSCFESDHDQGDKASCFGYSRGLSPVWLIATNKDGELYFHKKVNIGDTVYIDAKDLGESKLDSETNVYIRYKWFPVQKINFHTSCSRPLNVGDQFGGIKISSFVPKAGRR